MLIRTTIMTIMIVSLHLNTMGIIISISIIIATINIIGVLIIRIRITWAVGLVESCQPSRHRRPDPMRHGSTECHLCIPQHKDQTGPTHFTFAVF